MSRILNAYDALRNEIVSMQEQQRNVWIYMYVLFSTIFILGIELSYNLFLITYIILIPFQTVINRYNWYIQKISTYIRVFYEEEYDDLKWECMHVSAGYKEYYKKLNSSILGKIRYTGASQLGFLSTGFYIGNLLIANYNGKAFALNFVEIFLILLSILLFFLTVMLNREYVDDNVEELEFLIRNYKETLSKDKA